MQHKLYRHVYKRYFKNAPAKEILPLKNSRKISSGLKTVWIHMNTRLYTMSKKLHRKMAVYFDLDDGQVDPEEMDTVFNPMGLSGNTAPSAIKNYPIAVPKIDLLVGEESKRRFDWTVRSKNPESEGSSVTALVDMFMEMAIEEFKKEVVDEKELEQKIKEYARFAKYKFKDLNEITASKILKYLNRSHVLPYQFNKGFRNALVAAREVFQN